MMADERMIAVHCLILVWKYTILFLYTTIIKLKLLELRF